MNAVVGAVAHLGAGGVIAFPTETVYGLGADAHNGGAIARVTALKGRDAAKVMSVHISGEPMARRYAAEWPEVAARIAERFWPGPVTIILRANTSELAPGAVAPDGSVGLRCPDHALTLEVIERFGRGIVGTSANMSGEPPALDAAGVLALFADASVMVLDGGPSRVGVASTVVRLTDPTKPEVLRRGSLSASDLGMSD